MSEFEFYLAVLQALESIGARYMVVGAYGASAYGVSRSTHDIDLIVDLDSKACDALSAYFPLPRYYVDPDHFRNSIHLGIMFNIIDTSLGLKADLVPLSREPEYRQAFARRMRAIVVDSQGNEFEIWCARPEDIIVGKLRAWQEGRSNKHPADIYVMLNFLLAGLGPTQIDLDDVARQAARIGSEAVRLWHELLIRSQAQIEQRPDLGTNVSDEPDKSL
jgi:hypothetical protein